MEDNVLTKEQWNTLYKNYHDVATGRMQRYDVTLAGGVLVKIYRVLHYVRMDILPNKQPVLAKPLVDATGVPWERVLVNA